MEIEVQLFGSLKKLGDNGRVVVTCQTPISAKDFKKQVVVALRDRPGFHEEILSRSALAFESKVLGEEDLISQGRVMLLPPVCGG